jgi:uroporphyrinogen decarboxylase
MSHNCGKANHVLKYWADDVKIDRYYGFSYLTDKNLIKKFLGDRICCIGGINTITLHDGTVEDVKEDVRQSLQILKDCKGYIIMDGHNVPPGTPIENLNAVTEAAEIYGRFY